jgi:hypothetical protein
VGEIKSEGSERETTRACKGQQERVKGRKTSEKREQGGRRD